MGLLFKKRQRAVALAMWNELRNTSLSLVREHYGFEEEMRDPINGLIDYNIKNSINDIYDISINKTAYLMVFNIAFDLLTSGKYHIGYGCLGLKGEQMLKFAIYIANEVAEMGYQSEEDSQKSIDALRYGIAHAG